MKRTFIAILLSCVSLNGLVQADTATAANPAKPKTATKTTSTIAASRYFRTFIELPLPPPRES